MSKSILLACFLAFNVEAVTVRHVQWIASSGNLMPLHQVYVTTTPATPISEAFPYAIPDGCSVAVSTVHFSAKDFVSYFVWVGFTSFNKGTTHYSPPFEYVGDYIGPWIFINNDDVSQFMIATVTGYEICGGTYLDAKQAGLL